MLDTIDLLEAIGTNAALRHASNHELANYLAQEAAPDALIAAVKNSDSSLLSSALGYETTMVNHDYHTAGHGEEKNPNH